MSQYYAVRPSQQALQSIIELVDCVYHKAGSLEVLLDQDIVLILKR